MWEFKTGLPLISSFPLPKRRLLGDCCAFKKPMNAVQSRNSGKNLFGRRKRTGRVVRSANRRSRERPGMMILTASPGMMILTISNRRFSLRQTSSVLWMLSQSNWTSSDKLVLFRRQNEHFLGTHESVVIAIYAGYKGIQGMPKTFYLEGQHLRTSSYSEMKALDLRKFILL